MLAVALGMGLVRLYELDIDRRHRARLVARGAVRHGRDGLWVLVLTQVVLLAGLVVEGVLLHRAAPLGPRTWLFLGVVALAVGLRHSCVHVLGDHWTLAVYTVPGAPLVTRGPYRFLHHPNYVAVAVEFLALPLAFGLWWTLAATVLLGAPGLLYRLRREEAILSPLRVAKTGPR